MNTNRGKQDRQRKTGQTEEYKTDRGKQDRQGENGRKIKKRWRGRRGMVGERGRQQAPKEPFLGRRKRQKI